MRVMKRKYRLIVFCSVYLFVVYEIYLTKRDVLSMTSSSLVLTSQDVIGFNYGERVIMAHQNQEEDNQVNINQKEKTMMNDELDMFLEDQNKLKNHIKDYCQQFPSELPTFEKGFSSLIVDRVYNLTYCPIYKVASTSWAIALLKLRGKYNPKKTNVRDMMDVVFKKVQHSTGPQETEDLVKFMFVRHPFERLISAFRDKFENASQKYFYQIYGEKMIQQYRRSIKGMNSLEKSKLLKEANLHILNKQKPTHPENPFLNPIGPTFEEFVKFVLFTPKNDDHWRPFYIQCSLCHMQFDYTMRFENFVNDSTNFLKILNLSDQVSVSWHNPTAKGPTNVNIGCQYFNNISQSLAFEVYKKYEHDFKLFNYNPDDYIKCAKPDS